MLCAFPRDYSLFFVAVLGALGVAGCDSNKASDASSDAGPTPLVAPSARSYPVPVGPRLAILAGQGVGPVRLGATVATIERLMESPCEVKTATLCRYVGRALELELDAGGKTVRIRAHRAGRAAGSGAVYGVFNGAIPPDLQFNMLPQAIQEHLGPPRKVEPKSAAAAPEAETEQHYDGMVLEYDRLPNGRLVLGGVRIPN